MHGVTTSEFYAPSMIRTKSTYYCSVTFNVCLCVICYYHPHPPLAASNSYAPVFLFSLYPSAALCESSCANIDRENVKWCVRIADPDRNIETCISLNGTEEVFESTCDAEPLNLEPYLSLPDVRPHTFVHVHVVTHPLI